MPLVVASGTRHEAAAGFWASPLLCYQTPLSPAPRRDTALPFSGLLVLLWGLLCRAGPALALVFGAELIYGALVISSDINSAPVCLPVSDPSRAVSVIVSGLAVVLQHSPLFVFFT